MKRHKDSEAQDSGLFCSFVVVVVVVGCWGFFVLFCFLFFCFVVHC